jgi:uncharacterized protein
MKPYTGTIIIAISVILGAFLLARGYKSRANHNNTISVTGLGEENFTSDLIVWRADFSRKEFVLKDAYTALNADQKTIKKYLAQKGISNAEIIFDAVNIQKDFTTEYDFNGAVKGSIFNGYILSQTIKIESKNVDKVENLSREATELIDLGIELNSYPPSYFYTKLADLKLKMIESATKDAKLRAEKIASSAGDNLGSLKKADMGVFQITAQNSTEDYSWGGSFNTSSKRKTANITVRLDYMVD